MLDHYNDVSLFLPMNGAHLGSSFLDMSPRQKTTSVLNSARTSTAQFKFYDSSGDFTASTNAVVQVAHHSDLDIGSGDWTVECWVYTTDAAALQLIYDVRHSSQLFSGWVGFVDAKPHIQFGTGSSWSVSAAGTMTMPVNTWFFVSYSRSGGDFYVSMDGGVELVATNAVTHTKVAQPVSIGNGYAGTLNVKGYLQDLVITKGHAKYTSAYTPPPRHAGIITNSAASKILDKDGADAIRTMFFVPRSAPSSGRIWTAESDASGLFESPLMPCTEMSRVVLSTNDTSPRLNDIVDRIAPV